jgi:Mg-chelatase subunit ChlD
MRIELKLNKSKVAEGKSHDLDLLVRITAPMQATELRRRPVHVMPVVDVSGSMQGGKLASVKTALLRLLDHLVPGDHLGLVVFHTNATVVSELLEVSPDTRARFAHSVNGLLADEQTNLGGGILEAYEVAARFSLRAAGRMRLVLLTDGLANCGPATSREELLALLDRRSTKMSVSAFGYGEDCDQVLLAEMASRGGGSYGFMDCEDAVMSAFARELGGLVSTCATNVEVTYESEDGPPGRERLGELLHGAEQVAVVPVRVNAHRAGTGFPAARVVVTWTDADGKPRREIAEVAVDYVPENAADFNEVPEVARARDERMLQLAQLAAEKLARAGQFDAAFALLAKAAARLSTPALVKFLNEQLMPAYRNLQGYLSTGRTRGSAASALRRKRVSGATREVEETWEGTLPTEAEEAMTKAFRKGKSPTSS